MAEHSPGPWSVYIEVVGNRFAAMQELCRLVNGTTEFSGKLPMVVLPNGLCVAVTGCGPDGEASARLIAAAPELLRACQTFETWLRREEAGLPGGLRDTPEGEAQWREWYDENLRLCAEAQTQARAAIAKATGGGHG